MQAHEVQSLHVNHEKRAVIAHTYEFYTYSLNVKMPIKFVYILPVVFTAQIFIMK